MRSEEVKIWEENWGETKTMQSGKQIDITD